MTGRRFQDLSPNERRDVLNTAQEACQIGAAFLEKDVWVVATLDVLFGTHFAEHLIFKGGTSLSKAWRVIRRFSEDIDVTYDVRAFAKDSIPRAGDTPPPTRSRVRRWTEAISARLEEWVRDEALPALEEGFARAGLATRVRADGERLHVGYDPLFEAPKPLRTDVIVEFGARSTGDPNVRKTVTCDAAPSATAVGFPEASPRVLLAERTFWEKATAMHVFCCQERRRGDRRSRHWHDLARLGDSEIGARALADHDLALEVARHKAVFFVENDSLGNRIDYEAAVTGNLRLVPDAKGLEMLADDYEQMLEGGQLLDDTEPFDELMERCAAIETRANEAAR